MYKTAAVPAELYRASTGKKVLVPLSRYEQALFRRDMSQQFGTYLFSCSGWSHEAADIPAQDFLACRRSGLLSGHGSRLVHAAATSPRRGTSHRRRSLTRSSHCACHGTGRMAVCVCTAAAVVVVCSSDVESQLLV